MILETFPSDPNPKTIVNLKLNTKNAQSRKYMFIDYTGHKDVNLFKGLLSTPWLQECKWELIVHIYSFSIQGRIKQTFRTISQGVIKMSVQQKM